MKQILFFALKEDLVPMLVEVESKGPLQYILSGNFLKREFKQIVFTSGVRIPNLGKATADQWSGCERFLVCEQETAINLRTLQGYDGNERICIDQLTNPDSVGFTAGGVWNEDVVLNGCVGTASESQASQALMK